MKPHLLTSSFISLVWVKVQGISASRETLHRSQGEFSQVLEYHVHHVLWSQVTYAEAACMMYSSRLVISLREMFKKGSSTWPSIELTGIEEGIIMACGSQKLSFIYILVKHGERHEPAQSDCARFEYYHDKVSSYLDRNLKWCHMCGLYVDLWAESDLPRMIELLHWSVTSLI